MKKCPFINIGLWFTASAVNVSSLNANASEWRFFIRFAENDKWVKFTQAFAGDKQNGWKYMRTCKYCRLLWYHHFLIMMEKNPHWDSTDGSHSLNPKPALCQWQEIAFTSKKKREKTCLKCYKSLITHRWSDFWVVYAAHRFETPGRLYITMPTSAL